MRWIPRGVITFVANVYTDVRGVGEKVLLSQNGSFDMCSINRWVKRSRIRFLDSVTSLYCEKP